MTLGPAAAEAEGAGALGARELGVIASVLRREAGIVIAPSKGALVRSRLVRRLRALGLEDFESYCRLIQSDGGGAERAAMVSAMTTNVTRFFREPHHFEALRERLRGDLGARARAGERVRLWSAGCSSGEEPYSLALTVLDVLPDAPSLDLRILATDLDPAMLSRAREARYPADALRDAPAGLAGRHFEPAGEGHLAAGPALRRLVAVRPLNLIGPWPVSGPFDLILCRNVAIYFDGDTRERLWARLAALLRPEGRLCVGHSERVVGPAADLVRPDGVTTTYVRRADGHAAGGALGAS